MRVLHRVRVGGVPVQPSQTSTCLRAGAPTITVSKSVLAALVVVLSAFPGSINTYAQTLARPGWVGSGLTTQAWFKHAIFYEIDTRTFASSKPDSAAHGTGDLKGITQRLDYIHSLGVDAVLLKPLSPANQPTTIEPALGDLDALDDLTLQASRLKIRVLLELPAPDPAVARFWLTRGIAGFYVPGNTSANSGAIEAIRRLLPTYVGLRVLITDADLSAARSSSADLLLDRTTLQPVPNSVPGLRTALEQSQSLLHSGTPIFTVSAPASGPADPRLARIIAAVTLLNRSAALITAGQELGLVPSPGSPAVMPWGQPTTAPAEDSAEPTKPVAPITSSPDRYTPYVPYVRPSAAPKKPAPPDPASAAGQDADSKSLLNFYRELGRLHHGATALHDGEEITFNHDDRAVLTWFRKPSSPSQANPAILVACNLSEKPVGLSLKADVTSLQLHGTFLRTILRSDDLMGGVSLDPITLPPFGVYVGSLRY